MGSHSTLQVDSNGGSKRLVLFSGTDQVVLNTNMPPRHTHAIVIRLHQYMMRTYGLITPRWDTHSIGHQQWSLVLCSCCTLAPFPVRPMLAS
jgi:hypothetical protein